MKNKIEKAIFITEEHDFKKNCDRIYFGNEFCQNLIPSLDTLKRFYDFAFKRKKQFTFVTPYVTDFGLKIVEDALSFLNQQGHAEIVFNDWGVFKLMKDNFSNLSPVLGRLLTKQRRDPRMRKIFFEKQGFTETIDSEGERTVLIPRPTPQTLYQHFQTSLINIPLFQKFLVAQGIMRLEIDNLAWEMDIRVKKPLKVTLYIPYGYVATSRKCGKLNLTNRSCAKKCQGYFFKIKDKISCFDFYSIGNTVFYKTEHPSYAYLKKIGVTRTVYQPRLPF